MNKFIVFIAFVLSATSLLANNKGSLLEREDEQERVQAPDGQEANMDLEEESAMDEAEMEEENATKDMEYEEDVLGEEEVPVE
jgi:hypothetical protein